MRPWIALSVLLVLGLATAVEAGDDALGTLVVVVKTSEGTPLAGASVLAWNADARWAREADDEGRAVFEGLAPGTYGVFASASGRVAAAGVGEVGAGGGGLVEVALKPGVPFAGRVIDGDGKPVSGAYVEVVAGGFFEGYGETFAEPDVYARTWTDEHGLFRVGGLPPDRVATVTVSSEGFERGTATVRARGESVRPRSLEIRLVRGGRVTGVVRDPDGRSVDGAVVYLVPEDDEGLRENPRLRVISSDGTTRAAWIVRADEEGRYEIEGLPLGGAYVVAAEAKPWARSAWSEPLRPTAEAGEGRADVVLREPARLRVHLLVPEGHVLGKKSVRLDRGGVRPLLGVEPHDETGGLGVFRRLTPGTVPLVVEAGGFLPVRRDVEVAEGAIVDVDVRLDPGSSITGVLLDERGRPVAGMTIEAERKEDDETGWHALTAASDTTDEEGRFTLTGLRPGRHEVRALRGGFGLPEPLRVRAPAP
ncbi:MAG: carboxypeptidase regulatory-like domain-containing protein, partial [Planctomycetota bacterium]